MTDWRRMVKAERHLLAGYLDGLAPQQWAAPTWCDKWNVQQVVGHLVAAAHVSVPHFAGSLVRRGFSFDRFVENDVLTYAAGTPAETRARFEEVLDSDRTPPGPAYVALGEVMVHGEDIRRALGDRGEHPAEHVVTLAEQYRRAGWPLHAKRRLAGLRLEATDCDFAAGDGPLVRGPGMSLVLAMVGRAKALDDCEGDGVVTLAGRA